ncbi:MAG TPA: glycosyltransferase family 9 protein [Rhabdochlamydiaceae bacterium]|jgi:heptosyltransferase-1
MEQPRTILIVKTSAIGDVIHTFPVLEYLRQRFPQARIDWVVETGIVKLLHAHPLLSSVIPVNFKKWRKALLSRETLREWRLFLKELKQTRYDLLFDLQGNSKSALVTGCAQAEVKVGFGWRSVREKTNLLVTQRWINPDAVNVRDKYLRLVQDYYEDSEQIAVSNTLLQLNAEEAKRLCEILDWTPFAQSPALMIAFGSKWANKQLEAVQLENFLGAIAKRYPFSFMLIYSNEQEKQMAERLASTLPERAQMVGELTLPLWQALMWRVKGVIAVDSAALHLCATTSTPSFSFFGPSSAVAYKPSGKAHFALQGKCPYEESFVKLCPQLRTCATGACLKNIPLEEMLSAFSHWVSSI